MARTKSNAATIKSLEEADAILKEMCEIEASIESIDNKADKEIAKITENAASLGKPLRDRYKSCHETLKAFATYFRGEIFKDKKSLDRPFGTLGFRKAPDSITCSKATADLLKQVGLESYVRVRVEPDKEAMLSLSDETLTQVEAARKSREDFYVETKRELVNQELAKRSA